MKKTITTIMFSILILGSQYAQEESVIDSARVRENAIGISFGTGFGLDYSRALKKDKLYVTASYNTFVYSFEGIEQEFNVDDLVAETSLDFKSFDLKISYHPFLNAFKLVGGVGFFSSSNINVLATFKNNIIIGDVEFNAEDSGNLDIDFNWSVTAPYLGLGFGRAVPNRRLGFAVDFGTYFSSSPEITLAATGVVEQTKDQEGLLNESFESFKFIPYASFRLSYSF